MATPPPPSIPASKKSYQRGQKIEVANPQNMDVLPEWFTGNLNRKPNQSQVYTVVTRERGLQIIHDIISVHKDVPPENVVVFFDIDRTLRHGDSNGMKPRDPHTSDTLSNLSRSGTRIFCLTGAHADSNPLNTDATHGALDRIRPINLHTFFIDPDMPAKETIVKTPEFQVRHRGRVIVSAQKDWAIDYIMSFILQKSGISQGKAVGLIIFVDDAASQVFSVFSRFKSSTLHQIPVVCVFYEPTLEMCSHNPKDSDNPNPTTLEEIYNSQMPELRLVQNKDLLEFTKKVHNQ